MVLRERDKTAVTLEQAAKMLAMPPSGMTPKSPELPLEAAAEVAGPVSAEAAAEPEAAVSAEAGNRSAAPSAKHLSAGSDDGRACEDDYLPEYEVGN